MAAGNVGGGANPNDPNAPVAGGRQPQPGQQGRPPQGQPNQGQAAPGQQGQQGGRHRAPDSAYAWFPTTYDEMTQLVLTGKLSRKVRLVPTDVIEHVRSMVLDNNSEIRRDVHHLEGLHNDIQARMVKNRGTPVRDALRVGWRMAVALGTIAYLPVVAPFAPSVFVGAVMAGIWLYVHQEKLRKWRRYDNQRVLKAIETRDKTRLRSPFPPEKIRHQQLNRIFWWGVMAAFSPVGFVAETAARVGTNARLRRMKSHYEDERDVVEARLTAQKQRIETTVVQAARSQELELPEGVPISRAAYDNHYYNAMTPPAGQEAPLVGAGAAGGAGDAVDAFDPRRRRPMRGGASLA